MSDLKNMRILIEDATLTGIADAIRAKEGSTADIPVPEMASRIIAIESGGIDTSDATATEEDIAEGATAYIKGKLIEGAVDTVDVRGTYLADSHKLTVYDSENRIEFTKNNTNPILYRSNTSITIGVPVSEFGNAKPEDVIVGKTFTSKEGIAIEGTYAGVSSGGTDTGDGTALDTDIAYGKVAYSKGERLEGKIMNAEDGFSESDKYLIKKQTLNDIANQSMELAGTTGSDSTAEIISDLESANTEIDAQVELIDQLTTALEGKAAGNVINVIPNIIQFTPTSKSNTLSISELSASDYGYLLNCSAVMLFCYTRDPLSDNEIYAGVYSIAEVVGNNDSQLNRTFVTDRDYMVIGYSDIQSVVVTKNSNGISLSISTDGAYFAANATYYIVGFTI